MSDSAPGRGRLQPWLLMAGYFIVFFLAMTLGGSLFLLGGIVIVLAPGALPQWVEIGYVLVGIVGSVAVAVLVANGVFRLISRPAGPGREAGTGAPVRRAPRVWGWLAGIVGTVIAAGGSAAATILVTRWLG